MNFLSIFVIVWIILSCGAFIYLFNIGMSGDEGINKDKEDLTPKDK